MYSYLAFINNLFLFLHLFIIQSQVAFNCNFTLLIQTYHQFIIKISLIINQFIEIDLNLYYSYLGFYLC